MDFTRDILPLKDKLYRLALRLTMQREDAEDVVQETLIKLWNIVSRQGQIENLEAYAITTCRNMALNRLRQNSQHMLDIDSKAFAEPAVDSPHDTVCMQEGLSIISQLMARLPEKQRTCMQLRDFEGMNYRDIALAIGITEDQVKINIFRARKFVKEHLTV